MLVPFLFCPFLTHLIAFFLPFFLMKFPVDQNVGLLPVLQMSWTSLSLCSRLLSLSLILPLGPHCMSTWTTRSDTLATCCCPSLLTNRFFPPSVSTFLLSACQGEEKQLSEKSLHPPTSPAMLPDHLKCNILKAQMEAAFRVSTKVHSHLTV